MSRVDDTPFLPALAEAFRAVAEQQARCALGVLTSDNDQARCAGCNDPYKDCYRVRTALAAAEKRHG